ncbi:hypothetical protein B0H11DRAFT_2291217 [Mycena galericulata]|nr:hypothetical protein B0H11DRAFT_2291217 [Mycena galericulata]
MSSPPAQLELSEVASSRLTYLLQSNDVPVADDIPAIRAIIFHNQARVGALNAQLDALRTRVEQIEKERDEIEDTVRKQTAVISAVRRVPSELISEIFSLTPCTRRRADRKVTCPPWRLGHICRSWRNTALSNPFLWRSVEISWVADWNLLELETQLLRSGNVPLQVSFGWWKDDDGLPFLDLLLLHCERWVTLSFLVGGPHRFLLPRLRAVQGRLPQLKKLDFIDGQNTYGDDEKIESFLVAPNLREIFLADSGYEAFSPPILPPWNQITRYRGVLPPAEQKKILLMSPALVECGLGVADRAHSVRDGRVALLPHLRRLYVDDSDFLSHVTAPLLQHLYVDSEHGRDDGWDSDSDPILRFVQRSSCRLTRLVFHCFSYGRRSLLPLLESLPALEYLVIDIRGSPTSEFASLWSAMTVSGSSSDLCPNLTFLAWRGRNGDKSSFDTFFAMIRSRVQPISHRRCRLSSLRLIGVSGSVLRNCLEDGLKKWEDEFEGLDVAFTG